MAAYDILLKFSGHQFIKFIVVGGVNTLVGLLAYILFLKGFDLDKGYALAATYVFGMIFNFFSIGLGVFKTLKSKIFLPFTCNYLVLYIINFLLLDYMVVSGISALVGQIILVLPMAILSFHILKFIFSKSE